jgi:hypothetical protein
VVAQFSISGIWGIDNLNIFGLFCSHFRFLAHEKYFGFQTFDFEHTRWGLFQKFGSFKVDSWWSAIETGFKWSIRSLAWHKTGWIHETFFGLSCQRSTRNESKLSHVHITLSNVKCNCSICKVTVNYLLEPITITLLT